MSYEKLKRYFISWHRCPKKLDTSAIVTFKYMYIWHSSNLYFLVLAALTNLLPLQRLNSLPHPAHILKPSLARHSRGQQFLYINNRIINSRYVFHAIVNAYGHKIESREPKASVIAFCKNTHSPNPPTINII